MQSEPSSVSGNEPVFICDVLDTDECAMNVMGCYGLVVYVKPITGTLPSPITNVIARKAHPPSRLVVVTPAQLIMPSGCIYDVNLLAALPLLQMMRPSVRAQFRPPTEVASDAQPVVLEGLPLDQWFRPRKGRLVATGVSEERERDNPATGSRLSHREVRKISQAARYAKFARLLELKAQGRNRARALYQWAESQSIDAAMLAMYSALRDEDQSVREAAAAWLGHVADQIPLSLFLDTLQEKGAMNAAEWKAAAHVYNAHADEVPIEALFDLYHGDYGVFSPMIRMIALEAMGNLGERATDDTISLLAEIVSERRAVYDIRVCWQAALSLGRLGARAPIEALIACIQSDGQPEMVAAAARALALHPANIPDEIREEARLLSDVNTARRVHYQRIRDRLRRADQLEETAISPEGPEQQDG